MPRITFEDKLRFDAVQKLQQLQYKDQPVSFSHHHGNNKIVKAWRGVNFAPSHHKMARLSSAKMIFTKDTFRSTPEGGIDQGYSTERRQLPRKAKEEICTCSNYLWKRNDNRIKFGMDFYRKFKPLGIKDDAIEKARERRAFTTFPFFNPAPFDHRGLDASLPNTRLVTLKTPDPFNIRLKTLALNDNYKQYYTDPLLSYGTRNISFKFRTFKTPEPTFVPHLSLRRGCYSPAFTAYNAYLDRINKTISS